MTQTASRPASSRPSESPDPLVHQLYVIGGQQRRPRPIRADVMEGDWYEYNEGIALKIDIATARIDVVAEYETPEGARPLENPAILYKSGSLVGDRLYATTQTEVLVYRMPSWELETRLSLPFFNDVHHARPTARGTILVAVTGLDMVAEVTLDGDVVNEWNVLEPGAGVWGGRFSKDVDYRLVPTTKPHLAHPNHVFLIGDEPWATRFHQKDAISLLDPSRRIDIGVERLHDGVVYGDRVYFTSVDGRVVIADTRTLKVVEVINLGSMHEPDTLLGWCRGLLLDGYRLWIGFSRIRPTAFRENVAWVSRGFRRSMATHVACYDLRERRLVSEIKTEDAGLNAVFGIFAAG